ncbi:MAG: hypothetical protein ABH864_03230 [archaeon]
MNKTLKIILLGILIWIIPFLTAFLFWDLETNQPTVDMMVFNSIMAFVWAIGLAIALPIMFKKSKNPVKDGWTAGISWYVILLALDIIFLVWLFGTPFSEWAYMFLTYLNTAILTIVVGYIAKKR